MRISVEIDASQLKLIQKLTGQKKKAPAISQALSAFLRQKRKARLIQRALSGQTDYSLTNEELEALDVYEAR